MFRARDLPWHRWVPIATCLVVAEVGPAAAQAVKGVVVGSEASPVRAVSVRLQNADNSTVAATLSDSMGMFLLSAPAGNYSLRAQRFGYGEVEAPITLFSDDTVTVEIRMSEAPLELEPIVVRARSRITPGREKFEKRESLGRGTFITSVKIRELDPRRVSDVFEDVPGLRLVGRGGRFRPESTRGSGCLKIRLNEFPFPPGYGLESIHPFDITGIEVYPGVSEVPPDLKNDAFPCGLVVIWTRGAW